MTRAMNIRLWCWSAVVVMAAIVPVLGAQNRQPPLAAVEIPEVEIRGTGAKTVLLIGCMSCRWKAWEPFMNRNADRYQMIAVTLPGFGGTPVPPLPMREPGSLWQDAAVRALASLLRSRGDRDVIVVGHSFGGFIALRLAAFAPDLVSRVIAVDSPIATLQGPVQGATHADRLKVADAVIERNAPGFATAEGWRTFNLPSRTIPDQERRILYHGMFMATPRAVVGQYWLENLLQDMNGPLREATQPVLDIRLYAGTKADVAERVAAHRRALAANGTRATVRTLAAYGSGHYLHEQWPEFFDEAVRRFIAGAAFDGVGALLPGGAEWW